MKKRKVLSLFAILFVAIFALSVCFFAACKGGEDETDDGVKTEEPDGADEGGDGEGEGSEPGSGNENEGQTRSGTALTGDEPIIGSWSGEVEIVAAYDVYGGTIEAEMNVEITAEYFSLAFTPSEILIDESLDTLIAGIVSSALTSAGIIVDTEFTMFEEEPVYVDGDGCYADINGDYVKCQLPLETNEAGQLCISFDETMSFGGFPIDIVFDAKLDKAGSSELPEIKEIIALPASSEVQYTTETLDDGTTATFKNNTKDLSISTEDGVNYAVVGTASEMGEAEARYYDSEDIKEGAYYVVIKIAVEADGSVYFDYTKKTYVNVAESEYDGAEPVNGYADEFIDGYIYVIQALLDEDEDGNFDSRKFTVTAADGTATECVVSFEGVKPLTRTVTITCGGEAVEALTLEVGDSPLTLIGAVTMSDGSTYSEFSTCTWESSDPTVATAVQDSSFIPIYRNAELTAVSAGQTTVTLTLGTGETATCVVTVVAPSVSIYGDKVNFGMNGYNADFENEYNLTVTETVGTDGVSVFEISGAATFMTTAQINAFNGGTDTTGGATEGDAFIIIKISAPYEGIIDYGGKVITVTDGNYEIIIQKISKDGVADKTIKVYEDETAYNANTPSSTFVLSFDGVVLPTENDIVGTWSNNIQASASALNQNYDCTADVELTFNIDRTYTLEISNIKSDSFSSFINGLVGSLTVTMSGTWAEGDDGAYILTGEEGNSVSVTLSEDAEGVKTVSLSFSASYSIGVTLSITVTSQTLVSGTLEENAATDVD